ncbi:aldehyde oxidase GLOX [Physcomitrium patens]|uniref:Galactose oxidase-like Early set domain-containing protein n=1 Tax=Physcomitrium patens TaxID=3218 RepID=A0A2K1KSV9_PHYPA|nr:aldehyde oxidase GLOX-like [Physcomitrium patens]PNR56865.1 hypothetical protein PHYPA_003857 [Physcomitrium patens]|eukprot:XP_024371029.1 aldehyde oxidase GLOX-like [Physcomitrella patens]
MHGFRVAVFLLLIHMAMAAPGSWQLLMNDSGIASMHTVVLHTGTVLFLDRTNVGPSHIRLADGNCRNSTSEMVSPYDCFAHSVEFTPGPNTVRPLTIQTDTWCSSGAVVADGTLVQTGGDFDGSNKIRYFKPCASGANCDWAEDSTTTLQTRRWYATNQVLADGSILVVGGQNVFTYEFVPGRPAGQVALPFLQETHKVFGDDQNLYPFLHLLPSGNVFIFARRDSILLDPNSGNILRKYPSIEGEPRNYPTQGSSVMLPLDNADGFTKATILVCGGANDNAYSDPKTQYPASQTCGLLEATAADPQWTMLNMPFPRVMSDMILLPNGRVLLINGAQKGSAGWEFASDPALNPVIYNPTDRSFEVQAGTYIPRMYHSTAVLLPSAQILVAGSNTHQFYTFKEPYPTELRVEAFLPDYLHSSFDSQRPTVKSAPSQIAYGSTFVMTVTVPAPKGGFQLRLASTPWATHSFSQGQRQLALAIGMVTITDVDEYSITATAPPHAAVAPAGYYMLFAVQNDVPGFASWVQVIWNQPN